MRGISIASMVFLPPWPNELPSATVSAIHHYHRSPCVHYSLKTKGIFFGRPPNFYKESPSRKTQMNCL